MIFGSKMGSPEPIFAKICATGAKTKPKSGCIFFFKIEVESLELEKGWKKLVFRAEKRPEKVGLEGGTSPYHLPDISSLLPKGYACFTIRPSVLVQSKCIHICVCGTMKE